MMNITEITYPDLHFYKNNSILSFSIPAMPLLCKHTLVGFSFSGGSDR